MTSGGGVVGRYLREWRTKVVCFQETLMEQDDCRIWHTLGWGKGALTWL